MEQVFKRDIDSLDSIFDFAGTFLNAEDIGDDVRYAVELAVEELFTNMVKYNTGGGGDIAIRISRQDEKIVVSFQDVPDSRPTAKSAGLSAPPRRTGRTVTIADQKVTAGYVAQELSELTHAALTDDGRHFYWLPANEKAKALSAI